MTSIADTRLLLTFKFPPSPSVREKISRLIRTELSKQILIPSIVISEYLKIAGARVGFEAALTHIDELETRGGEAVALSRDTAIEAGRILLASPRAPIADALIVATCRTQKAAYVLTDDPHFKDLNVKTRWI